MTSGKRTMAITVLALLGAALCPWAGATGYPGYATPHTLLDALVQGDLDAQNLARQLLTREDPVVARDLAGLIDHPEERVWRGAFSILADFANEVSAPGRESDRLVVTDALMTLVAPEATPHAKEQGLRLLPVVMPEGHGVEPVAALLRAPEFAEKARAALREMGTDKARAALRDALGQTSSEFGVALLNALYRLQDAESIPAARRLTRDADPEVRLAAARALSWTGDPRLVPDLRRVCANADAATRPGAFAAMLVLADSIAMAGGNWETAMAVYREVLHEAEDPAIQGAALMGLGRFGNETAVDDIVGFLNVSEDPDIQPMAVMALDALQGHAANRAMLAAYEGMPDYMRRNMPAVFGAKADPVFVPVLAEAAGADDPAVRDMALAALAATGVPEAVPVLVAAAGCVEGESRERLAALLRELAESFKTRGEAEAAGQAFIGIYDLAEAEEMRRYAVEGMMAHPTPAAFDVLLTTVDREEFAQLSPELLAGMVRALLDADRGAEAEEALELLTGQMTTTEAVRAAMTQLGGTAYAGRVVRHIGFIRDWHIVGPFLFDMEKGFQEPVVNPGAVDLSAAYPARGDGVAEWKPVRASAGGLVDLMQEIGPHTACSAYALAVVNVPEAADAVLRIGSDDGVRAWVNGELVHEHNIDRGSALDQELVPVHFNVGDNEVLLQISQNAGGWNFLARLTTPEGAALDFSEVTPR